jgi:hypothetical protein
VISRKSDPRQNPNLLRFAAGVIGVPAQRMVEVIAAERAYNIATVKRLGFKPD